MEPVLECLRAVPGWEKPLTAFFGLLSANGDGRDFHPHSLDAAAAADVCGHCGDDVYYLMVEGDAVVAYGMLRGWDEGFEEPSLGIAVHPEMRGVGFGRLLMRFLHLAAARRGAPAVRLRVRPENERAIALYRSLGYAFEGEDRGQLVGRLEL